MRALIRIVLGVLVAVAAGQAAGQKAADYPTKPIRWIIDFPPAGVSDILTRTVGQKLTEYLGQGFVYDNRPGANGVIANALVAKAPSDGYTLGFISQPLSLQLTLVPNLGFSLKDFAPVALIAEYPSLLVVQAKTPVDNAKDFSAWAKKKSPSISYASSGAGGAQHLAMELFRKVAGFDALHVPYNGSAAGMIDLMGGRVDAVFVNVPGSLPHIRAGRVKAIALAGRARMRVLPEVPTFAESGYPFDTLAGFAGAAFPAGTPKAIVNRMSAEIAKVVKLPDIQERIFNAGGEPRYLGPEEFTKYLVDDVKRWAPLIKEAGATPQT
ncbi:MAG: tripartite tricarboxylate transporter substrate binding protein [Betaproteobacteria bacterium]|nr:tripartite tricarboxylate transporter substrate binding protein [Betaproteobacteria bacterium]